MAWGLRAFVFVLGILWTNYWDESLAVTSRQQKQRVRENEILYLPSIDFSRLASVGYKNTLAHYYWFSTINYFGKHYRSDQDYRWLSHRCNLVVTLNPSAEHVYRFCSLMLAWEQNEPALSINLLTRAMAQFPDRWEYPYHRGFIYYYFLKDQKRARDDFVRAAKLPGVPQMIGSLAAKTVLKVEDDPELAQNYLNDMLRTATDPLVRQAIENRIKKLSPNHDFKLGNPTK